MAENQSWAAYERAAVIGNIVNGFKASGIWPIDRHVFPVYLFDAAQKPVQPGCLVGRVGHGGEGATLGEMDNCDPSELNICVEKIPKTPVGLPKTKEELDTHCRVFNIGMSCMDAWIRRCLPTDGQRLVHQQIGGARAIMRFLCANETTTLRREFLKEQGCWARVSPEWSGCVNELQNAVRDISDRAQLFTYFNRNGELCCARDDFMMCVTQVGQLCSASAGNLLKRLAWVLAQDVAACSQPHAYCKAPPTAVTAPLLTALSTVFLYPPRL